jgi:hypothetical protein
MTATRLTLHHDARILELVSIEACVTQAGRNSQYLVWRIPCKTCGHEFRATCPATLLGIWRLREVVNCPLHRRSSDALQHGDLCHGTA